jgi:hypothetical protein
MTLSLPGHDQSIRKFRVMSGRSLKNPIQHFTVIRRIYNDVSSCKLNDAFKP